MYLNIQPHVVEIQRARGNQDLTLFTTRNKYMYKDITNTSPIKIVSGPTLYNDSGNVLSLTPKLRYTTPTVSMTIGNNGDPTYIQPYFIHFDIQ